MSIIKGRTSTRFLWLVFSFLGGICGVLGVVFFGRAAMSTVLAAPIPPPEGYPKLILSTKEVSPTLAHTGGATLFYKIEIVNTGAYAAQGVNFYDMIPASTSYNGDARASSGITPTFAAGALSWTGDVGFDSRVQISFSATVAPTFTGILKNEASLTHPLISRPVTVTAETVVTDLPILDIGKTSEP